MRSWDPNAVAGKRGLEGLHPAGLVKGLVTCSYTVSVLSPARLSATKFSTSRWRLEALIDCTRF